MQVSDVYEKIATERIFKLSLQADTAGDELLLNKIYEYFQSKNDKNYIAIKIDKKLVQYTNPEN